jgi:hypothetical protein
LLLIYSDRRVSFDTPDVALPLAKINTVLRAIEPIGSAESEKIAADKIKKCNKNRYI